MTKIYSKSPVRAIGKVLLVVILGWFDCTKCTFEALVNVYCTVWIIALMLLFSSKTLPAVRLEKGLLGLSRCSCMLCQCKSSIMMNAIATLLGDGQCLTCDL